MDQRNGENNNIEEDDKMNKNKDLFWFLTFPGRIIMTLYSFHGLFFIINIILQYIIFIPGFLFDYNKFARFIVSIIYLIFAISSSNIMVIPLYEFLTFPFLRYDNPLSHLLSFIYVFKEKKFDIEKIMKENPYNSIIVYIMLFLIEIIYIAATIVAYLSSKYIFKDYVKCVILFLIYSDYLTLLLCYFVLSIYLIFKILKCPTNNIENNNIEDYNPNNNIEQKLCPKFYKFSIKYINNINTSFGNRPRLPNINLISSLIDPFLIQNYDIPIDYNNKRCCDMEDFIYTVGIYGKICLSILSIIAFFIVYIQIVTEFELTTIFFFIILLIIMAVISLSLNFPCLYSFRKSFGVWYGEICCPIIKRQRTFKPAFPKLLPAIRFVSDLLIVLASLFLLFILNIKKDNDELSEKLDFKIKDDINVETKNLLLPNICYSSIHNIPLYLFLPFINDAYYYGNHKQFEPYYSSSLQIQGYKKLFFNNDYIIENIKNLINKTNTVKMIQYNVINTKKQNEVTILSIKGTSYRKDIFMDAQLYCSSVLLTLLSTFSLNSEKEGYSFRFIEYSLSIPYRIFFGNSIISEYLNYLKEAYIKNEDRFFKNVVIVGHSLGGGLAKLFARIMNKQAIALSGPGVNAFHSLWDYKGKSENFEISAIDLIPDKDPIPRVEVSGGTVYRIVCKSANFECHSSVNSLCEVLIMCRHPNYEVYCNTMTKLGDEKIKEIYESSELNNYSKE
jgi:lipase ATG15